MLKTKIYLITKKISFRIPMFSILFLIEIRINHNFIGFVIILSIIDMEVLLFKKFMYYTCTKFIDLLKNFD